MLIIFILAIAQKAYRARNDKELSVQPGEFFEVCFVSLLMPQIWQYPQKKQEEIFPLDRKPVCNGIDVAAQWS